MEKYLIAHKTNRTIQQILSFKHEFIYQPANMMMDAILDFIQNSNDVVVSIAEFESKPNNEMINEFLNSQLKSKIITLYIDLDDTIFDFMGAREEIQSKTGIIYPQATYGFFANLEPFDDAVETVKELIAHPQFDVKFATAPSIYNPLSYTEKRVSIEKHFGFENVDRLFLISEKDRLDRNNQGFPCILIDDISMGYGQENFHAQIEFGSPEFATWTRVKDYLLNNLKKIE